MFQALSDSSDSITWTEDNDFNSRHQFGGKTFDRLRFIAKLMFNKDIYLKDWNKKKIFFFIENLKYLTIYFQGSE